MPLRGRRVRWVLLIVILYAGLDELTQPLVARDASAADWAADVLGAVVAVTVLEVIDAALGRRTPPAGE